MKKKSYKIKESDHLYIYTSLYVYKLNHLFIFYFIYKHYLF